MSDKIWEIVESDFLTKLYKHKGALEECSLLYIFKEDYNMEVDLFGEFINKLTEKEYCKIEKIMRLDNTESNVVFITEKGLSKLADNIEIDAKKVIAEKTTYELKCQGYPSFSEWLEDNKKRLALEQKITRMFARSLADLEIVIMNNEEQKEIENTFNIAIERMENCARNSPELNNSIAYAIVMTIYNKMIELQGTENIFIEARNARKIIRTIMPERHAENIDYI